MGMPALSIRQPWAWLILHAGKDIENRDWSTRFRGRILIHASKSMTNYEYDVAADTAIMVGRSRPYPPGLRLPPRKDLDRGGIVGAVDIVDCVRTSDSPWFIGECGFVLANAAPCPFVPYKGRLGIFSVPPEAMKRLEELSEGAE